MRITHLQLIQKGCWLILALIFPTHAHAVLDGYLEACRENQFLRCEEVKALCSEVVSVAIPKADGPTEIEKQSIKGCSSKVEYYGYGKAPDLIKARKCAYLEYEQGISMDESFYGASILMMIYANGEGVGKNIDLALKFACEDGGGSIAEYEGHILHLEQMRNNSVSSERFDFCDDSQSQLMMGRCADREAEISRLVRANNFEKLLSLWSEPTKAEFEKLNVAWRNYLLVSDEEIDHNGAMGVTDSIFSKNAMQEDFLESLLKLERGKFPSYSDKEFAQADRELNTVYKTIQNASENDIIEYSWGSVTKDKIRQVQRAWLKYRDAWVVFAGYKYPTISAASWKTWLTRERVGKLKSLIENRQ